MKWLIYGANGWIGQQVIDILTKQNEQVIVSKVRADNRQEVEQEIQNKQPDRVIALIGRTHGPGFTTIDYLEQKGKLVENVRDNLFAPISLSLICKRHNIHFTYLGTGCIFEYDEEHKIFTEDTKKFTEEDEPNFFGSLYSRSRVISEKLLKEFPNVLQLRVRIPILGKPHPKNLIDKMLKYPQMINMTNSCTIMEDFVPAVIQLMEMGQTGIFNMTNIGAMNHVEIMTIYKEIVDPNFQINVMSQKDQDELNKRRSNDVLNTDKREKLGVHMPPLEESLRRILEEYKKA